MWRQKVKTRNWCWRKNWCHHKNHLFAPEGRATPRHSVSSQGLRILRFRISLFKISIMKLYILLNGGEYVFACMINNRGWEREGNGAKREQYLDWWNKNWLETRLSQNPLIFFIWSSSISPFAGLNVGCMYITTQWLKRKPLLCPNLFKLRNYLLL